MQQKSWLNRSFVKFILTIVAIWTIGLGGYLVIQKNFQAKEINIVERDIGTLKPQLHGFDTLTGFNLILSNTNAVEQFLKKSNPVIRDISIEKKYPRRIIITLTFYKPEAALKGDRGFFIVSSNGTVLDVTSQPDPKLAQITFYQLLDMSSFPPGSKLEFGEVKVALTFLQSAIDLGLKTSKIEIDGSHMIALYADQEKIIFSQEKDVNLQKYQFETIIKDFKNQKKTFKSLDVRFDKPVVVF